VVNSTQACIVEIDSGLLAGGTLFRQF
jgi:hypothetical protein